MTYPMAQCMAQRLTLDRNQNLWLLSYLFQVDCWYVDVLHACMVEGRAMLRSLRRVVARRSPGLLPGARRAEGCDARWQEAFHAERFLRSPQMRALSAIGKCGPRAYNWDGCVRVSRGAPPGNGANGSYIAVAPGRAPPSNCHTSQRAPR